MDDYKNNYKSLSNRITLSTKPEILKSFACECFSGMGSTNDNKMTTADSSLIQSFLNISLPLADRMFSVIKSDEVVDFFEDHEFVSLINIIYAESINVKALFFFNLLNYTNDYFITKEDTVFLFAHITPEANEFISSLFGDANMLTQEDYVDRLKDNCDLVLFFYAYLWHRKVFDETVLSYYDSVCKTAIMNGNNDTLSPNKRKKNQSLHIKKSFSYLEHGDLGKVGIEDGSKKRMLSSLSPYNSPTRKKKQPKDISKMIDYEFKPSKRLFEVINGMFGMGLVYYEEEVINGDSEMMMTIGKGDDDLEELNAFENDITNSISLATQMNIQTPTKQESQSDISTLNTSNPFTTNLNTISNTQQDIIETTFSKSPPLSPPSKNHSPSPLPIEYDQILNDKYNPCKIILIENFLFIFPYIDTTQNTSFSKCILLTNSFIDYDTKNLITIHLGDNTISFNFKQYQADFIAQFNKINPHYKTFNEEYTIHNVIGKGQFGNVHLVTKKSNQKTYCAKIITKSHKMTKQIRREVYIAKFLKKHKQKNIVRFDNVIETFNTVYIIMEYIKEGDLSQVNEGQHQHQQQQQRGATLLIDYESIMKQLVTAITFLHSYGIMHRDLKLKNILFNDREELKIKVIDFGLSIILSKSETTREQCGTFVFSAPELLMKKPYTFKADIWSLGVIGFWFLFQKYPIKTNAKEEVEKLCNSFEATWFMKDEEYWRQNYLRRIIRGSLVVKQNIRMSLSQLSSC